MSRRAGSAYLPQHDNRRPKLLGAKNTRTRGITQHRARHSALKRGQEGRGNLSGIRFLHMQIGLEIARSRIVSKARQLHYGRVKDTRFEQVNTLLVEQSYPNGPEVRALRRFHSPAKCWSNSGSCPVPVERRELAKILSTWGLKLLHSESWPMTDSMFKYWALELYRREKHHVALLSASTFRKQ